MDFASDIMMIDTCLRKSIELLQRNTTPHGVMAASRTPQAEARNYTRIFARDAAICAFGMLLSQDPSLREGAKNSLLTLAAHQADNGQIPKFVDPSKNEGDFWYVGCIDATLWWLIALNSYDRHVPEDRLSARLAGQVYKALVWLQCQEHPTYRLLQQNEASDWADIMPRSGFVLYTHHPRLRGETSF